MSEITRVPLQPVGKGSLTRIWIGVILALLLGATTAWAVRYQGLVVETLRAGTGPSPTLADVVKVNYVGTLANGKPFDKGEEVPLPVEGVMPGFSKGLLKMQRGGKYRLTIPAAMAYGAQERRDPSGQVVIPANSDLVFEVELLDFMSAAELEQRRQAFELQRQQMGRAPRGSEGGESQAQPQP